MSYPTRNRLVAWTEIEGEVMAVEPESSMLHRLNPTASFLWHHLTGERSSDALCQMLVQEFDVPLEQAKSDFEEFISRLSAVNLVRLSEDESQP